MAHLVHRGQDVDGNGERAGGLDHEDAVVGEVNGAGDLAVGVLTEQRGGPLNGQLVALIAALKGVTEEVIENCQDEEETGGDAFDGVVPDVEVVTGGGGVLADLGWLAVLVDDGADLLLGVGAVEFLGDEEGEDGGENN